MARPSLIAAILFLLTASVAAGQETEAPAPAAAAPDTEATEIWPYQEPLFALYAVPSSHVRLRAGFATNPETDSMGLVLEGAWAFGPVGIHLRLPMGLAMADETGTAFTLGDAQLGAVWCIHKDEETQRHLSVGLEIIGPTSRIGEESDVAAVQAGTITDDSNLGKRYLVAQRPMLDMGLNPRLNFGISPWVAFGQNIGRVSLQTDFGLLMLVMDNMDESVYGTDRRFGMLLFFDLAAPVAIWEGLSLVAEFNGLVALDELQGTGFAFTLGPRYKTGSFSAGLGVQLPLGVDNKPPDDDKMLGRYDQALVARHHVAGILDLVYRF